MTSMADKIAAHEELPPLLTHNNIREAARVVAIASGLSFTAISWKWDDQVQWWVVGYVLNQDSIGQFEYTYESLGLPLIEFIKLVIEPAVRFAREPKEQQIASTPEQVDHPSHYGGDTTYEVIKVMEAWLTPEEYIGALKFNAFKYMARAGKKGATLQDVQKGNWYAVRLETFIRNLGAK